ncbi:MAG: hypothetical protein Q9200_003921, partial [Gallowayella weberi]
MASSAGNRAKFISSLIAFMRNHGFDGVDLDWEYPAADDRGGKQGDTANYVLLVKEMKAAFSRKYGLSVTLPASYWYLQHFDVKAMQPYVDWFNVMSYDIHGVWDSSNKFTGPYIRSGASAGACTGASGILSLAEIGRAIDKYGLTPSYDAKAAVKWITFNTDQWVSYDDDQTFMQKMDYARDLGLAGTMVWAIDQASSGSQSSGGVSSNDAYSGVALYQKSNKLSKAVLQEYQAQSDAQDSCYTSFCGKECAPGYSPNQYVTKGQVGELGAGSACKNGEGGSQIMCCRGFQPSMQFGRDADLVQAEDLESSDPTTLAKRDFKSCSTAGVIAGGTIALVTGSVPIVNVIAGFAGYAIITAACWASENEAAVRKLSGYSPPLTRGQAAGLAVGIGSGLKPGAQPPKGTPNQPTNGGVKQYGPYPLRQFPQGVQFCSVTYTCKYGKGFDQVCDNQKYGLDKITTPFKVFNYDERGSRAGRSKSRWAPNHNEIYRRSFGPQNGGRYRCEVDEFPLNSLQESADFAQQALRSLDGAENGKQGQDWQFWLLAEWWPCSSLMNAPPPITWSIGDPVGANDPRTAAAPAKTIARYGFDSVSGQAQCWPTYSLNGGPQTTIKDHGFRVGGDDPLFGAWPSQNYRTLPQASVHPTDVSSAAFVKKRWGMEQWEFGEMAVPTRTAEAIVQPNRKEKASTGGARQGGQHVSPAENQVERDTAAQDGQSGTDAARATITAAPTHEAHLMKHAKRDAVHGHG